MGTDYFEYTYFPIRVNGKVREIRKPNLTSKAWNIDKSDIPNKANNIVKFVNDNVMVFSPNMAFYQSIMPTISNVDVIESDGKAKVVRVYFSDGTEERAVLDNTDTFNLEQGISICITKKLLSIRCDGNGSSIYNKLVRNGVKVYKNKLKAEKEAAERKEIEKARIERLAKKKAAKREKRVNAEKEEYIRLEAEAFLRALNEYKKTSSDT